MSFPENRMNIFRKKNNVGGIQNLPPTPCLRSAYVAAYAPAYVERTRRPERGAKRRKGLTGRGSPKWGIFAMEAGSMNIEQGLAVRPGATANGDAACLLRYLGV